MSADTSRAAFASLNGKETTKHAALLRFQQSSTGMTADECAAALDVSILYMRPRIAEMAKDGMIVKTELCRTNESGRSAIVWKAA